MFKAVSMSSDKGKQSAEHNKYHQKFQEVTCLFNQPSFSVQCLGSREPPLLLEEINKEAVSRSLSCNVMGVGVNSLEHKTGRGKGGVAV